MEVHLLSVFPGQGEAGAHGWRIGEPQEEIAEIDEGLEACLFAFETGALELGALFLEVKGVKLIIETAELGAPWRG
jgi:hypothetical protein